MQEAAGDDAEWKADQESQPKQEAIGDAVPVRWVKRDLLSIAFQVAARLDLPRTEILAKIAAGKKKIEVKVTITELFASTVLVFAEP